MWHEPPTAAADTGVAAGRRYVVRSGGAEVCKTAEERADPGTLGEWICRRVPAGTAVDVEAVESRGVRARGRVSSSGTAVWVPVAALAPDRAADLALAATPGGYVPIRSAPTPAGLDARTWRRCQDSLFTGVTSPGLARVAPSSAAYRPGRPWVVTFDFRLVNARGEAREARWGCGGRAPGRVEWASDTTVLAAVLPAS